MSALSSTGLQIATGGFFDDHDRKKIEALRQRELDRRNRLLKSKHRAIGVDVAALQRQVEEKRAREHAEAEAESRYAEHMAAVAAIVDEEARREAAERASELEQLVLTWREQRVREKRREFDLSDPRQLAKDRPPREGDYDPRCTVSGFQIFDGEDLGYKERREMQRRQLRKWLDEQVALHKSRAMTEEAEERAWAMHMDAVRQLREEMEAEEAAAKADELQRQRDINLQLMKEKRRREAEERRREEEAAQRELQAKLSDPMLAEDSRMAVSVSAPGRRVRMDHYKGMSRAELAAIREEQEAQRREKARMRELEKEEERRYVEHMRGLTDMMARAEVEEAEARAEERARLGGLHREQRKQHAQTLRRMDEVYDQRVDPAYFEQWGRSGR